MKLFTVIFCFLISVAAFAQECVSSNCQSQLLRVEIDRKAIDDLSRGNPRIQEILKPSADAYFASEIFRTSFMREYPMEPMGFPYDIARCQSEKAEGDPNFKDVDCNDPMLCSNPKVNIQAKSEACFTLPCGLVMGRNMGQCPSSGGYAMPTRIQYPKPIALNEIQMKTEGASLENKVLKGCFLVTKIDLTASAAVEFAPSEGVNYEKLSLLDMRLQTDSPRRVCMSARVDINASPIVSQVKIEREGDFVTDAMVDKALVGTKVEGLSGYSPTTVNILKLQALPPLVRHFRPAMESAIQRALGATFEQQAQVMIQEYTSASAPTQVRTASNSVVSELGVGNMAIKKYVDLLDCSLMIKEAASIPANHACLNQLYPGKEQFLKKSEIPAPASVVDSIAGQMDRQSQVTSESVRARLEEMKPRMQRLGLSGLYQSKLAPTVNKIVRNQNESQFLSGVELITRLGDSTTNAGAAVAIPEICDAVKPSPHSGREMRNCPIQTYVDLNEMNRLFDSMYKSGRICHAGKGDRKAEVRSGQQVFNGDGSPRGSGCLFNIEDTPDGMRCYLNGAPKIVFDGSRNGYKVLLNTKDCFRGSVALGQGKIGGDINFEIAFTPTICGGGDFCLSKPDAQWNVVPNSARFALRESSFLNGMVKKTIDGKLNQMIGETIRIPLMGGTGMMANLPVIPEGRVDTGDGFFGACLTTAKD